MRVVRCSTRTKSILTKEEFTYTVTYTTMTILEKFRTAVCLTSNI